LTSSAVPGKQNTKVTAKGNNYLLFLTNSPSLHISINAIQLAQLNKMIK